MSTRRVERVRQPDDEGFMLLAVIVLIFLLLLALSVAAPRIAMQLRRDREVETEHRAKQYVRGIELYYKKLGHYPGSIEQLEKTNNERFLRQKYVDPLTGKADWRIIHQGENKTKVKGFFGEDLLGLPGGLGSLAGSQSNFATGTGGNAAGAAPGAGGTVGSSGSASSFGSSGSSFGSGSGNTFGGSGAAGGGSFSNSSATNSNAGQNPGGSIGGNTSTFGSSSGSGNGPGGGTSNSGTGTGTPGLASQDASDFKGTGGPIIGVGSAKSGEAILVVNEQTNYQDWEFLYDPRVEQLKAKASLLGGGGTTGGTGPGIGTPASGFGGSTTTPGSIGNPGSTNGPGSAPTSPGTPISPGSPGSSPP